jgi:hypothetical protein
MNTTCLSIMLLQYQTAALVHLPGFLLCLSSFLDYEKEKLLTLQSEQRKELSAMLFSISSSSTVCKCS